MSELVLPKLSASPARLHRSGLKWLKPAGASLRAREPLASSYLRLAGPAGGRTPLPEEQNDLQVVLAPEQAGAVTFRDGLSFGGYRNLVEAGEWRAGEVVAHAAGEAGGGLAAMVLMGRRGFESGEGRGSLLAGWHDKVRASWQGSGTGRFGHVLALGTCEQNAVFRGEDMAFLSWFARAPGPVQISSVSDERCVHSSAVLLQHVRRTAAEAAAITEAVIDWVNARTRGLGAGAFPAFQPAARGVLAGRWPEAQEISFALHLLAEAVGTSPILERTEVISSRGILELDPPDVIALTLGSEVAPHFRHRKTGWVIAMHGFRFGPFIGPGVADWLRRDFEPLPRSVDDTRRDLAALADEVHARTSGTLLVQNMVASAAADRVSNFSWLGDDFARSLPVLGNESNLMLQDLTRSHAIAMLDSDALAAELGVNSVPDRFHASLELVEAQRTEVHRFLRESSIPGF